MSFTPQQSTVCGKIMELLGQNKVDHRQRKVAIVSQDSFYGVLSPDQVAKAVRGQYNFDHPGRRLAARTHVHQQLNSFLYTLNITGLPLFKLN